MGERWMMFVSLWLSLLGRECFVRSGDLFVQQRQPTPPSWNPCVPYPIIRGTGRKFTWNKDIYSITCYCSH